MTVPVVKALALAHPDVHIIMVSRPFAKAFYENVAENIQFVGIDLKNERYKGFLGMEHLYQDLKRLDPDMVADLHDVLRTKYVRWRFRQAGISIASIDKHRKGRKALTRKENKVLVQQPTSFEKYLAVFNALGLDCPLPDESPLNLSGVALPSSLCDVVAAPAIGIAPFAAHDGKIYPLDKMEQVIANLLKAHPDLHIMFFGGGKKEKEVFDRWCAKFPGTIFASALCTGMRQEIALMQTLRCMVTMDSGNMHMASLVGTPVVSIWGATHPLAGFMGWRQKAEDVVQADNLTCRPCSIYGNKPCLRHDYACLATISPATIVAAIEKYL